MRKLISLYCVEENVISFYDEDDLSIKDYSKNLLDIFNSNNVVELETNDTIVYVRPTKLIGIKVIEVEESLSLGLDDNIKEEISNTVKEKVQKPEIKKPVTTTKKRNYIKDKQVK